MMDIIADLLQWFINVLIKNLLVEQLKMELYLRKNRQKNYKNQLLENLGKEEYTHLLWTIFTKQI